MKGCYVQQSVHSSITISISPSQKSPYRDGLIIHFMQSLPDLIGHEKFDNSEVLQVALH